MNSRVKELDFLKCIFIILMIIFHLVYIGDSYPYAKQVVYTFHMSAFLVISGYLNNVNKKIKAFGRSLLWIFIPYVCMETGYVIMSAILPVREKITELSAGLLLHKAIIAPMGPYWYLHTLMLCNASYYLMYRMTNKWKGITRFILLGILLYGLSELKLLTFANAIYFLAGVAIRQSGSNIIRIFQPSLLALFPLIILCYFPENLNRGTLAGVTITYLVISLLLAIYTYLTEQIKGFFFILAVIHWLFCSFHPCLLFVKTLPAALYFRCDRHLFYDSFGSFCYLRMFRRNLHIRPITYLALLFRKEANASSLFFCPLVTLDQYGSICRDTFFTTGKS